MAAGIPAAHRNQGILRAQTAMELPRLDKWMRIAVVLFVVLAVAVFSDFPHPLDRSLGPGKQKRLGIRPAPSGAGNDAHMLWREDHNALAQGDAAVIGHRVGN